MNANWECLQFKTSVTAHQLGSLKTGLGSLTKWIGSCGFSGDIVLIYVATSTTIDSEIFVEGIKYRYSCDHPLVLNSNRFYFCYVDQMKSAEVWGEIFLG
jgi:hypothetical protein